MRYPVKGPAIELTAMIRRTLRVLLYSLFVLPFSLHAQDTPVFRTATDVVVVPVTVTDRSGRIVTGLTADQFEISDAGARRPITQFSVERVPISLGILLDFSGSMARDPQARAEHSARWADTRSALELLVTRLDPKDEVLFAVFADKVALAVSWTEIIAVSCARSTAFGQAEGRPCSKR